jgi:hypothetical protein
MWPTVFAPEGIVGLAVVTPVWVYTRADEKVQGFNDLPNLIRHESLPAISKACPQLICLGEISGQRDEGIGWNPLPGMDAAED